MCRWRWVPLLSLCLSFSYLNLSDYRPEWKGRIDRRRRRKKKKKKKENGPESADAEVLWLLLWVTWSLPEVALVRSRHAIHRGVRETRRLRRHTHLPSTKPLLYGGRPALNFAQQPSSVVGDVVLWCSTTAWHAVWLSQSQVTLFSDCFQSPAKTLCGFKLCVEAIKTVLIIIPVALRVWGATLEGEAPAERSIFFLHLVISRPLEPEILKLGYKSFTLQWKWINMLISPITPPKEKTPKSGVCPLGKSPIRINPLPRGSQWAAEQLCVHWPAERR